MAGRRTIEQASVNCRISSKRTYTWAHTAHVRTHTYTASNTDNIDRCPVQPATRITPLAAATKVCRYARSFLDSQIPENRATILLSFLEIRAVVIPSFTCLGQPLTDNCSTDYRERKSWGSLEASNAPVGASPFFPIRRSAFPLTRHIFFSSSDI